MASRVRRLVAVLSVGAISGCASAVPRQSQSEPAINAPPSPAAPSAAAATASSAFGAIPADSPFAKIKVGMGSDEVFGTIGKPTSQENYQTGKGWIPFHFGGDNIRMAARYKGVGTITFSQNNAFSSGFSVLKIEYDPTEPGYVRKNN